MQIHNSNHKNCLYESHTKLKKTYVTVKDFQAILTNLHILVMTKIFLNHSIQNMLQCIIKYCGYPYMISFIYLLWQNLTWHSSYQNACMETTLNSNEPTHDLRMQWSTSQATFFTFSSQLKFAWNCSCLEHAWKHVLSKSSFRQIQGIMPQTSFGFPSMFSALKFYLVPMCISVHTWNQRKKFEIQTLKETKLCLVKVT